MRYAVGLMSGTSLDAVDAVLVQIQGFGVETECKMLAFHSLPIQRELRQRILTASDPESSRVDLICSLNMELGSLYSEAVSELLTVAKFNKDLDFIASHGQTIYHMPHAESPFVNSTLQIGDPSKLAYDHKTRVVFNFRMMDVVDGGHGAPLVPYTEYILYRHSSNNILLQNIGGIGNVTILPKNCRLDEVTAFDTGPGNMMINAATNYFYNEPYDKDGKHAKQGSLIPRLFETLIQHPYLVIKPPKSTGRELFGEANVIPLCEKYKQQPNDLIYTLTKFSAYSISEAYKKFIFPNLAIDQIIIGGGGAYNPLLMEEIRHYLKPFDVVTQEDLGFSSDAKEAVAFAILGNETLHNIPNNAPKATGGQHRLVLGQIAPNPWGD